LDAAILAALTEPPARPARVRNLLDRLDRELPTFDEVSFGLERFRITGYVDVEGDGNCLTVWPTPKAMRLRASIRARWLDDIVPALIAAVGAVPLPDPEIEDGRLGRLAGLDEATWAAETRAHRAAWMRTYVVIGATVGAVAIGGLTAIRALRRRRPGGSGP
jgi:hypothetical protein